MTGSESFSTALKTAKCASYPGASVVPSHPVLGVPSISRVKIDAPIKFDSKEIAHVYHFGAASTGGDSITYFPDLKVVVMGDVFQQGMNCDYAQGGSMVECGESGAR